MAVVLVGYPVDSFADNNELRDLLLDCSAIEKNTQRLVCVDKIIRSLAEQQIVLPTGVQSIDLQTAEKTPVIEFSDNELGQKYLRKSQARATSTSYYLIAAYKDHQKRWNFEFDNGQVWQQLEPRYLSKPKHLPVKVSISEGVFGSHNLRAESFANPVKVRRLN